MPFSARTTFVVLLLSLLQIGHPGPVGAEQYAFLVGVKDYSLNDELRSLKFADNDVHGLAMTLFRNDVPRENITLMTQTMAGERAEFTPLASQIRKKLELLLVALSEEDSLIVGFSGHGLEFEGDSSIYYCPLDAKVTDKSTLLSLSQIYEDLEACKAAHKLLLVDASHEEVLLANGREAEGVRLKLPSERHPPTFEGNTAALFSCQAQQVGHESNVLSFGPYQGGGVFFHYINRGLAGEANANRDDTIDLLELENFTVMHVKQNTHQQSEEPQTPQRLGAKGEPIPLLKILPVQPQVAKTREAGNDPAEQPKIAGGPKESAEQAKESELRKPTSTQSRRPQSVQAKRPTSVQPKRPTSVLPNRPQSVLPQSPGSQE